MNPYRLLQWEIGDLEYLFYCMKKSATSCGRLDWPEDGCSLTAGVTHEVTGLQYRYGLYTPTREGHCWNFCPNLKKIFDLSISQWSSEYPVVAVFPENTHLLMSIPTKREYRWSSTTLYCGNVALFWERFLKDWTPYAQQRNAQKAT